MPDATVTINKKKAGNIVVLEVIGALDASTTPQLNAELKGILAADYHQIVCDFKNLKYIASAGIGALFAQQKEARSGGGDIVLANVAIQIRDVFELLNFSRMFKMFDSLEEALRSFR